MGKRATITNSSSPVSQRNLKKSKISNLSCAIDEDKVATINDLKNAKNLLISVMHRVKAYTERDGDRQLAIRLHLQDLFHVLAQKCCNSGCDISAKTKELEEYRFVLIQITDGSIEWSREDTSSHFGNDTL